MQDDIRDILIDRYAIQARVYKMAQQLAADYDQREFVLMPLLTGSIIFVADLVRHLPVLMRIDVMAVSSYPGRATTNQGTRILYPTKFDVGGKHVLVIDDILDSGRTLRSVRNLLAEQKAASVKTCVLLKKRLARPPAQLDAAAEQRAALLETIALAGTRAVNRLAGMGSVRRDWTSSGMP